MFYIYLFRNCLFIGERLLKLCLNVHRSDWRGGWSCQRLQIVSYIYFIGLMYRYEFCNFPFHCYFLSFSTAHNDCSSPKFHIKFEAPVFILSYFVFG